MHFASELRQVAASGPRPGLAWDAKQAGDLWYQRINDLERLDEPTAANVKQTQGFYPDPQSPQAQALARLQSAMKSGFNPWHLRHAIGPVIGGGMGAVEDTLNPEDHHNPWLNIGSRAGEGMLLFSGLPWLARPGRKARSPGRVTRSAQGSPTFRRRMRGRSATGCGRSCLATGPADSSPSGSGAY